MIDGSSEASKAAGAGAGLHSISLLLQSLATYLESGDLPASSTVSPAGTSVTLLPTPMVAQLLDSTRTEPVTRSSLADPVQTLDAALIGADGLVGILTEPSLLFATKKAAKEFRQRLLSERRLWAVIDLPAGLLPNTGIGLSLLILVPAGGAEEVILVAAASEDTGFLDKAAGTRQPKLKDVERLANVLINGSQAWWVGRLPAAASDLSETLSPRRHLKTPLEQQIDGYFAPQGDFRLGDQLELVPSMLASRVDEPSLEVRDVGPRDLPCLGLMSCASGVRAVSEALVNRNERCFLRAGDLLINHSQTLGFSIAVVSEDAPAPGEGGWLAARSVWVYRSKPGAALDTRVLAMLLESQLGAYLLEQAVRGLGQRPHPRMLLELVLPHVDSELAAQALTLFQSHAHYARDILALQQRQAALRCQIWPLQPQESGI